MTDQRSIRGREAHARLRPAMLPFAVAAVAGLASVALPGPELDQSLVVIACAIAAGMLVVGLALYARHQERWLIGILPLAYLSSSRCCATPAGGPPTGLAASRCCPWCGSGSSGRGAS